MSKFLWDDDELTDALSRAKPVAKYSDEQPRGEDGKWTSGGGVDGAEDADNAAGYHVTLGDDGKLRREDGVEIREVTSIDQAIQELGDGHGIMLDTPDKAIVLLDRIRTLTQDAKEKGEKAKTYDLCGIYVKGSNLFCSKTMRIPRDQMPQLGGHPIAGSIADGMARDEYGGVTLTHEFVRDLRAGGTTVEETTLDASMLRASQNQLNGSKVAAIMASISKNGSPGDRIVVSADNYIVDGHHRWAADMGVKLETNRPANIRVYRVNMKILPLLRDANKFAAKMGMPTVSVKSKRRVT